MPPGKGRGGKHGRTKQDHQPATGRRDEDSPPRRTRPLAAISPVVSHQKKKKQRREKKQQQAPLDKGLQVDQRRKRQRQLKAVAASLPEGHLAEILSRVPYSSLCHFKCVSRSWLTLCSNPDIRRRSLQTLSGFFHDHRDDNADLKFQNLSGRGPPLVDPSLPFLRSGGYEHSGVEQCSSLLCKCWKSHHAKEEDECHLVVCNPATEEWTALPPIAFSDDEDDDPAVCVGTMVVAFLGFDTAAPSRFVVVVPLLGCLDDVVIYSSETGRWIRSGWDNGAVPVVTAECVFLNGFMHLTA